MSDSFDFDEYLATQVGAKTSISATPYRRFVSENPTQTSYFQPVLDLLDYRPSLLEPVPDVVMVEGKSDFYLLKYAIEVLGVPSDLHLVPGGGASALEPLIRLHIGWGKSFIVLLDGDAEGRKQQARYEKEFGTEIGRRCLTLPDACHDGGVREIENLLSANDTATVTDAVFAAGQTRPTKKKAISQAILELYARRQAVALDAATQDRIKELVALLQSRLEAQASESVQVPCLPNGGP